MAFNREKNVRVDKEQVRLAVLLKHVQEGSYAQKDDTLKTLDDIIRSVILSTSEGNERAESRADKITAWMRQNDVLPLLVDKLNEPQHLEKFERILRFMVSWREDTPLTDLDVFWKAPEPKNKDNVQTYFQSVRDYLMLVRIAWDLSREQLNYVFARFQQSWLAASWQQRSGLIDVISRVAEDDPRADPMTENVLNFLWDVYRTNDGPTEIAENARVTHLRILSIQRRFTHDRNSLRMSWLKKCLEEIQRGGCVVSALHLIRGICDQFPKGGSSNGDTRADIVRKLEEDMDVVAIVWSSLKPSWHQIKDVMRHGMVREIDPSPQSRLDASKSKYSYSQQAEESLKFFDYIRKIRQTDVKPEDYRMKKLVGMNAPSDELKREEEVEEARMRKIRQRDLKTESDVSNQMKYLELVASTNAVQPETKVEGDLTGSIRHLNGLGLPNNTGNQQLRLPRTPGTSNMAYGGDQSPPVASSAPLDNITAFTINTPGQCRVCGDTESLMGKNHGGWMCTGCKAFFERCIEKQTVPRGTYDVARGEPATKIVDEGENAKPWEDQSPASSMPSQVVTSTETVGRVGECTQMEKVEVDAHLDAPLDVIKPGVEQTNDPTGLQMGAALNALAKRGFTDELDLFRFLLELKTTSEDLNEVEATVTAKAQIFFA